MENNDISESSVLGNEKDVTFTDAVKEEKTKKKKTAIGYVTCDQLNLREEPDGDSNILFVLIKNTPVIIDTENSTGKYYKVLVNGLVGFCIKEFIAVK